jgi:hypothetical protein
MNMRFLTRMLAPITLGLAIAGAAGNAAADTVLITGAN